MRLSWGPESPGNSQRLHRFLDRLSLRLPEHSSFIRSSPDPAYRMRYFERLGYKLYERAVDGLARANEPPTLITDRPWDFLIVLDACRHDVFCHVYGSDVPHATSPNSATYGWAEANLVSNPAARRMHDVVLVTANPAFSRGYFELIQGWEFPLADCIDVWKSGWDDDLDTVEPEVMAAACRQAIEQGIDRAILHFLQPHAPFIGEPRILTKDMTRSMSHFHVEPSISIWGMIEKGRIPISLAMRAYEGNLRRVLASVLPLATDLPGRTVITSDHGNLFGEYGLFGHPVNVRVPELVRVPWLELQR